MEIHKITYSDGSESVFEKKTLEYFKEKNIYSFEYSYHNQIRTFEEKEIIPNLKMDLEQYAKDEYNLIDEDEKEELSDYDDWDIEKEFKRRNIAPYFEFANENINNKDFLSRFVEIVNRGNDAVIDSALETLERIYSIK